MMNRSRRSFLLDAAALGSAATLAPVGAAESALAQAPGDLSQEQVRAQLAALGLDVTTEDLAEVTHRINAISEAVLALDHPGLDAVEPLPILWPAEDVERAR
jgi:hypothetical protein